MTQSRYTGKTTADGRPVLTTHWQQACTLMTLCCRACFHQGKRGQPDLPCFSLQLCEQEGKRPAPSIPHWRNKIRGLVKRHYREAHPEWKVL